MKGEAESGDIQIEFAELLHDVDVSASSGDVNIKLEQEPKSLTVDYRGVRERVMSGGMASRRRIVQRMGK